MDFCITLIHFLEYFVCILFGIVVTLYIKYIYIYIYSIYAAAKLLQSRPTLCNPTVQPTGPQRIGHDRATFAFSLTVALEASLSMGFPWQEYWSGLPLPTPDDLSDPGI